MRYAMKIDVGQTVNTLANIGVISGIVFLAFELQQNNELLTAQARIARHDLRSNDSNRIVFQNLDLVPIFVKARSRQPLTEGEAFVMERLADQTFLDWQFVYVENQRGLLESGDIPVDGWASTLDVYPIMREVWEARKRNQYRADFVLWMDENVVRER